jgi:hypothetical protein
MCHDSGSHLSESKVVFKGGKEPFGYGQDRARILCTAVISLGSYAPNVEFAEDLWPDRALLNGW